MGSDCVFEVGRVYASVVRFKANHVKVLKKTENSVTLIQVDENGKYVGQRFDMRYTRYGDEDYDGFEVVHNMVLDGVGCECDLYAFDKLLGDDYGN